MINAKIFPMTYEIKGQASYPGNPFFIGSRLSFERLRHRMIHCISEKSNDGKGKGNGEMWQHRHPENKMLHNLAKAEE